MKRGSSIFGSYTSACFALAIMLVSITLVSGSETATSPLAKSDKSKSTRLATETGIASYYGAKYHGKQTASGEIFNMNDFTAAHPRLAFGTRVRVTNLESNRAVIVRINDRGPFVQGRVIDLSHAAAAELQIITSGLARVKLEVIE